MRTLKAEGGLLPTPLSPLSPPLSLDYLQLNDVPSTGDIYDSNETSSFI